MSDAPPPFIPGLTLNRRFYWEVVRPLLDRALSDLRHSAALVGYGSDVLGLDTSMSTDHNWGPRLHIYLDIEEYDTLSYRIDDLLRTHLPPIFMGYSVHFSQPDLADNGTQQAQPHIDGPVNHLLSVGTVEGLFRKYLGLDLTDEVTIWQWLALPEQKLVEVTSGEVFHDGLGTLNVARTRFAYFPRDVWKLKLAAQWQRLAEEEAFVGRTGDLGDDVGSWIISARLTRDLMRLAFLYARRYAPYNKWLGSAFAQLPIAADLLPHMRALTTANDWQVREEHLIALYARMAAAHNALGITTPISTATRDYFGRPFQVLFAGRFAEAISATIRNPAIRRLAPFGAVDQFTDNVAIHSNANLATKLTSIYRTA